jgi:hypothetical protein
MIHPVCYLEKPEIGSAAAESLGLLTGIGALFWRGGWNTPSQKFGEDAVSNDILRLCLSQHRTFFYA